MKPYNLLLSGSGLGETLFVDRADHYLLTVEGNFGGGTVVFEYLSSDGATWLSPTDIPSGKVIPLFIPEDLYIRIRTSGGTPDIRAWIEVAEAGRDVISLDLSAFIDSDYIDGRLADETTPDTDSEKLSTPEDVVRRVIANAKDGLITGGDTIDQTFSGLNARFQRKLSSGDLSLADSTAIRSDGNPVDSATNTAEINELLASLQSGAGGSLTVPPGSYAVNAINATGTKHLRIRGAGKRVSRFLSQNSTGNLFTIIQDSQGYYTDIGGFSVVKQGASSGSVAVNISYPLEASYLQETVHVSDIEVTSDGYLFGGGVLIENAWGVRAENLNMVGLADDYSPLGTLILVGRNTIVEASRIRGAWCQAPIYNQAMPGGVIGGEGYRFDRIHAVATQYMVYLLDGGNAPEVHLTNSHGDTMAGGTFFVNRPQCFYNNVLLYKRLASTQNWTGIWHQGGGGVGVTGKNIQIFGFKGSTAGGTALGMFLDHGDMSDISLSIRDCDSGVNLNGNSRAKVDFIYNNVTTPSTGVPSGATVTETPLTI